MFGLDKNPAINPKTRGYPAQPRRESSPPPVNDNNKRPKKKSSPQYTGKNFCLSNDCLHDVIEEGTFRHNAANNSNNNNNGSSVSSFSPYPIQFQEQHYGKRSAHVPNSNYNLLNSAGNDDKPLALFEKPRYTNSKTNISPAQFKLADDEQIRCKHSRNLPIDECGDPLSDDTSIFVENIINTNSNTSANPINNNSSNNNNKIRNVYGNSVNKSKNPNNNKIELLQPNYCGSENANCNDSTGDAPNQDPAMNESFFSISPIADEGSCSTKTLIKKIVFDVVDTKAQKDMVIIIIVSIFIPILSLITPFIFWKYRLFAKSKNIYTVLFSESVFFALLFLAALIVFLTTSLRIIRSK